MKFLTIILVAFVISNAGNMKIHSSRASVRGGLPSTYYSVVADSVMLKVSYRNSDDERCIVYAKTVSIVPIGTVFNTRFQLRYFAPWHEKRYLIKGRRVKDVTDYDIEDIELDMGLVNYTKQYFDSKKDGK